ncbi:MAG: hypothetical protein NTU93_07930 [Arthrobacter sp.]|nr:hypothetical protein [Arthrobacter sp.]
MMFAGYILAWTVILLAYLWSRLADGDVQNGGQDGDELGIGTDGELVGADACCCGGTCVGIECTIEYPVVVTGTGLAACAAGTYNPFGGWCAGFWYGQATDFTVAVTCHQDGLWWVTVTSTMGGLIALKGTATPAQLPCVDGHFSGAVNLTGNNMTMQGGPDWSAETGTATF